MSEKRLRFLSFFLLLLLSASTNSTLRIIGGSVVPSDNPWPWIGFSVSPGCGVNVIASDWVLTAAHCVLDGTAYISPSKLSLGFGSTNKNNCQKFGALEVVPYPCYDSTVDHDDIAMIRVNANLTTLGIKPVGLMTREIAEGAAVMLIGWGATDKTGTSGSNVLMQVSVPVSSVSTCEEVNPTQYQQNKLDFHKVFCTGGTEGKDSCNGDSGGPAAFSVNGTWYIAGIASTGSELPTINQNCGVAGRYGVYTKVSSFVPWIQKVLAGERPTCGSVSDATRINLSPLLAVVAALLLLSSF